MRKRILYSLVLVVFMFYFFSGVAVGQEQKTRKLPDLRVKFIAPPTVVAGTDIGPQIKLKVWNQGTAPAAGTAAAGANGYMVDVVLSTDTVMPPGFATYSPTFHEDVLLKGGRISNTITLNPGQAKKYPTGGGIPADAPVGGCYICAKVDSGNKITELNEANNVFCRRIYVKKGEAPQDDCKTTHPNPKIKFDHVDADGRVYIPVLNWSDYPDEMFRQAPELPPCGANPNSARTWVNIYDAATGARIYGFCALGTGADLQKIWFLPRAKKGQVYIVMKDRACKKNYKSNTVTWYK
jgi:hypothetical protein